MAEIILFALAVIGMTHIIVDSTIMQPFRDLTAKWLPESIAKVFNCYQCCGFWAGLACGGILVSHNPFVIFTCGCAGSFLANWGAMYLNYLEAKTIISLGDDK